MFGTIPGSMTTRIERPSWPSPGSLNGQPSHALLTLLTVIHCAATFIWAAPVDPALAPPYNQHDSIGPHHRRVELSGLPFNRKEPQHYVELQSGLHYFQGNLLERSKDQIEIRDHHAVADSGPLRVIFQANISRFGAVQIHTPDGFTFLTHVLGLSYFDAASGKSVLLAEVKPGAPELIPPNQILYRNALTDIDADIRYTYSKSGLEQDVILKQSPPGPAAFGLDPATTRLEVLTEFIDAPEPRVTSKKLREETQANRRARMVEPDLIDESLEFGTVAISLGKAFSAAPHTEKVPPPDPNLGRGIKAGPPASSSSTPIAKRWQLLEGRQFLIESVEYKDLPRFAEEAGLAVAPVSRRQASLRRVLPELQNHQTNTPLNQFSLNSHGYEPRGIVLDYFMPITIQNFTFESGTTYLINGEVHLSGSTSIEKAAVIKFTPGSALTIMGTLHCPNQNAILTSALDHTAGVPVFSEQSWAWFGHPALRLHNVDHGTLIRNLDIRYAFVGIQDFSPQTVHQVRNCRFYKCATAVESFGATLDLNQIEFVGVDRRHRTIGGGGQIRLRETPAGMTGNKRRSVQLMSVDDHGNSSAAATSLGPNSSISGTINYAGDEDFFVINLGNPGVLTAYSNGSTDTYGYLLDSSGTTLTFNDDNPYPNFRFSYNVSAGTYYLRVRHFSASGSGPYTIVTEFSGSSPTPPPSSDDHGNTTSTATAVNPTSTSSGNINYAGDEDYFRLQLPNPGTLTIYSTGSTDTYGYFMDAYGNTLAYNDDNPFPNFRISASVASGTYYVRIRHYSSSGVGAYTFVSEYLSNDDHGNTISTATPINAGNSLAGTINLSGDEDFFSVQITTSGILQAYTSGNTDTYGYLLNSSGTILAYDDDAGVDYNFAVSQSVSPGTYYVRVRHYSTSGTGSYTLGVDLSPGPSPPPAPGGLGITAGNGQMFLSWSPALSATVYNLKRGQSASGPFSTVATTSSTSYTDTGLSAGTTYYYVVSASNSAGEGPNSSAVSATTAPLPPANLIVYGGSYLYLTWTASSGAYGYYVKRSTTTGGPFLTLSSTASTSYTDSSVSAGMRYYYVVTAASSSGAESGPSTIAEGITIPISPSGLSASGGIGRITLSWNSSSGASSYKLRRSTSSSGPFSTIATGIASTSYSDSGLPASTTFHYVVAASNTSGDSSDSASASATTAPYDSDSDGLPDTWEMQYFGSLNQSPTNDPDEDRFTNQQEYQNGTHPNSYSGLQLFTLLK